MTARLLTDAQLQALARTPRQELADVLAAAPAAAPEADAAPDAAPAPAAAPEADAAPDAAAARKTFARVVAAYEGSIEGFAVWAATVFEYLYDEGGTTAVAHAVQETTGVRREPSPSPSPAQVEDLRARVDTLLAQDRPDPAAVLSAYDVLESALFERHDLLFDQVCLLLSHVYRTRGIGGLEASLRRTADVTLLAWMPRDLPRPPEARIVSWVRLLKGNAAAVRVEEDDEKFVITQDPCGTCGRQIARDGYPGPLPLAVVDEPGPLTFGRGGIPVYRTHVALMHVVVPAERRGVPWPVVQCPAGCDGGPCRILLFKDPDDLRAWDHLPPGMRTPPG